MARTKRIITLTAIATIGLLPAGAGATQPHGDHAQTPGAYICGISYSMNSVDGKYCPPRHATLNVSPPAASAYVCGISYSMNSVDGKYCPPRHATPIASLPPASAAPAKVIVRDSGFAWGDAAAGAGATLVIVLIGAGTATAAIRRNRAPSRVSTTS
jgi:hypothetical protein